MVIPWGENRGRAMRWNPGVKVGPYEIVDSLGAGGMGEVYRARDTRLHRDVALKVLSELFATDPERLARFEREAQVLAALKHPNIATIYGVHEERDQNGALVPALVLELVEGDTLAERIARGPLPIEEAVAIARQIADALEAAHEQGIVHRDLKPANVKVTLDGTVKVLDLGLAKLQAESGGGSSGVPPTHPDATALPTMTSPALVTGANVLLGTAAYMAPEQARGKAVDKRADIWAFGVILYEMLSGRLAFDGETITDVLAAVLHREVDWDALPAATPPAVRTVLRQCLQKDVKQRIRDMGDVRLLLDGRLMLPHPSVHSASSALPGPWRFLAPALAAGVAATVAGAAVWVIIFDAPPPQFPVRFDIGAPDPKSLMYGVDISPDGRTVAFLDVGTGEPRLWLRDLDAPQARVLEGLNFENRAGPAFWSPDGRSLGIWIDSKIQLVDVSGGPPQTLADVPSYAGGSWSRDNLILFADAGAGIMRMPAVGGAAVRLTSVDVSRGEFLHLGPSFLPDGRHFLYSRISNNPEIDGAYIGRIDLSPEQQDGTRLVATTAQTVYAPTSGSDQGYLLFLRDGLLTAQPFDPRTRRLTGDAMRVVDESVAVTGRIGSFAVSANGTLVYRAATSALGTVVAVNRNGDRIPLFGGAKLERAINPRVSPDGRRLALVVGSDLWAYDLEGRPPVRLTFDRTQSQLSPLWTPDGRRIVFERGGGPVSLFAVAADGAGGAPERAGPEGHFHPHGWTAAGELVAVRLAAGQLDLLRFAPRPDATPEVVQATTALEGHAASVSPNGRWLAYMADPTGGQEIWVRSLVGTEAPVRVSPKGGRDPVWAKNGRELYYLEEDRMMAVPVETGTTFDFKPPVQLFTVSIVPSPQPPSYDVTPDGRFILVTRDETPNVPISVILNWDELLRGRVSRP